MRPRAPWLLAIVGPILWIAVSATQAEARLEVATGLSIEEVFTDNLFFTENNREEDFGTFVSPRLGIRYETKNIVLGATYIGTAQYFVNNTTTNSYAQDGDIEIDFPGLTQRYKGLEVTLIETFNFTPEQPGFSFTGEQGEEQNVNQPFGGEITSTPGLRNEGIFTGRREAFENLAGVDLNYAWTPRLTPSLTYRNRLILYTSDEFADELRHRIDLGLGYAVSERSQVRATYSVEITRFEEAAAGTVSDDFETHSLTVGASHQVSPTFRVQGDLGGTITVQDKEEQANFNAQLSLSKGYSRGSLDLSVRQFVTTAGGLSTDPTLNQDLVGSLNHSLTRWLSGNLTVGISRFDSLNTDEIDILSLQVWATLQVQFLRWLTGSATYSYVNQINDGTSGVDAQRNTLFIGLTATALPWKIMD